MHLNYKFFVGEGQILNEIIIPIIKIYDMSIYVQTANCDYSLRFWDGMMICLENQT